MKCLIYKQILLTSIKENVHFDIFGFESKQHETDVIVMW